MKEFKECGNGFEQLIQYANGEASGGKMIKDLLLKVIVFIESTFSVGYNTMTLTCNCGLENESGITVQTITSPTKYGIDRTITNLEKDTDTRLQSTTMKQVGNNCIFSKLRICIPAGTLVTGDNWKGKLKEDIILDTTTRQSTPYSWKVELEPIE